MTTSTLSPPTDCEPTASRLSASSAGDRLASRLAWLAGVVASMTRGGCGLNTSEWSRKYDRAGLLRRIRPAFSRWTLAGLSVASSQPWTRWGMWAGGEYGELATLEHPTEGSASSSSDTWPTPSAMNPNETESLETWQARRDECRERHGNNGFGVPLGIAVRLWPTPKARDHRSASGEEQRHDPDLNVAVRLWPTPRRNSSTGPNEHGEGGPDLQTAVSDQWRTPNAYDGQQRHNAVSTERRREAGKTISLGMQVSLEARGLLNPAWVELLQGFPPGWTDIPAGPPDPARRSTPGSRRAPSPDGSPTE